MLSLGPRNQAASRAMRVEHEYARGGAVAYLAAWDVHQGKIFGRCEASTGIAQRPPPRPCCNWSGS